MGLLGALVRDSDRADIGRVRAVLLEPETKDVNWLEVALHDGGATALVPASAASQVGERELLLPYTADQISAARHEAGAPLTAAQAATLRSHYGFID